MKDRLLTLKELVHNPDKRLRPALLSQAVGDLSCWGRSPAIAVTGELQQVFLGEIWAHTGIWKSPSGLITSGKLDLDFKTHGNLAQMNGKKRIRRQIECRDERGERGPRNTEEDISPEWHQLCGWQDFN